MYVDTLLNCLRKQYPQHLSKLLPHMSSYLKAVEKIGCFFVFVQLNAFLHLNIYGM